MRYRLISEEELRHHGIKGQKWGVRRYQNKDGSLTCAGKKRYNDDEYDEERERLEQEVAARRGVKYVRKTKKEREAEDAENERQEKERRSKEDAAYKRTEDKMKEVDKKLQAKYDFNSSDDVDKYYKEYDEEWFKILYEERKKEGLSHVDLSTDELYHYGIKGQKWGVRQYQNKDGSLTEKGKLRYGTKENFEKQYPEDKKKTLGKVSSTIKKTRGTVDKLKNVNDAQIRKANEQRIKKDVSQMSDQELKKIVNRLNMEERYTQVMNSRAADEGKNKVSKILEYAGPALTVGVGAVELMIKIQEMKKK
jgi:hypothetical protein